jgi:hypothetical protein
MQVAQSPANYINSSKGCPSITESFPLVVFLELCATVAALPVVQLHCHNKRQAQHVYNLRQFSFVTGCRTKRIVATTTSSASAILFAFNRLQSSLPKAL